MNLDSLSKDELLMAAIIAASYVWLVIKDTVIREGSYTFPNGDIWTVAEYKQFMHQHGVHIPWMQQEIPESSPKISLSKISTDTGTNGSN
jgi:uncharacterized protein (UPF0264 family)